MLLFLNRFLFQSINIIPRRFQSRSPFTSEVINIFDHSSLNDNIEFLQILMFISLVPVPVAVDRPFPVEVIKRVPVKGVYSEIMVFIV